jgi:hypothetical protein
MIRTDRETVEFYRLFDAQERRIRGIERTLGLYSQKLDRKQQSSSVLGSSSGTTASSSSGSISYQDGVKDRYDPTGGLPVGPATGDRYIATATANGWTDTYIYEYNGSSWDPTTPLERMLVYVDDENVFYCYTGAAWVTLSSIIDHDLATNFVAAEHLLVGAIDHDQTLNFAANEHIAEAAIDHGSIAGLTDDDHTQYHKESELRTYSILNIWPSNGASFSVAYAHPLVLMPAADADARLRISFYIHADYPSVTTLDLKILYIITDANAYSGVWTIECFSTGDTMANRAANVKNGEANDFAAGNANEIYIKTYSLNDADIVAGTTLGVSFTSDAANSGELWIFGMWLEET